VRLTPFQLVCQGGDTRSWRKELERR